MKIVQLILFCYGIIFHAVLSGSNQTDLPVHALNTGNEPQIRTTQEAETLLLKAKKIEENDPVSSEILSRRVRLFALKSNNPLIKSGLSCKLQPCL